MGRNWLKHLKLCWSEIKNVNSVSNMDILLKKYEHIFQKDELGTIKTTPAIIHINKEAQPRVFKPRSVPFTLKESINKELDRLTKLGVLEAVTVSSWATPIVPVRKPDGTVRLCGDYKCSINPHLKVDSDPLPKAEELFVTLQGGKKFTKLDLASAYNQIPLKFSGTSNLINTPWFV